MSKLAHYLQQHIMGEVLDGADVRRHFSTDASIFQLEPKVVVYPRNEQDVRKVVRFSWQLAEKGRVFPITARGAGSDLTGASIGEGIMLVFPAHMNRIVSMDTKKGFMSVEPGAFLSKIQQTFNVQYRFVPPMPSSIEYATIGGAVANNSGGIYSHKYGRINNYVSSLRLILANGEVIVTKKLSKRELNKKLGLANFEGQIYRAVDTLLSDNQDLIEKSTKNLNSVGYGLSKVKAKDGSFDLTPLVVGAQGTLGVVSEVVLQSETYNPQPLTAIIEAPENANLVEIIEQLNELEPAAIEMVDHSALRHINKINPTALRKLFEKLPNFVLLVEFDDSTAKAIKRKSKKLTKTLDKLSLKYQVTDEDEEREKLWKVRHAISHIIADSTSKARAIPAIENAQVPLAKFGQFYQQVGELFQRYRLPFMSWGHVGMGQISIMPKIDLSETSGRQRIIRLMDEYYQLVAKFGGQSSGFHNEGRLRGQYLERELGPDLYGLNLEIKKIFDPYNMFNPGVKVNVNREQTASIMRVTYHLGNFFPHLPRL